MSARHAAGWSLARLVVDRSFPRILPGKHRFHRWLDRGTK